MSHHAWLLFLSFPSLCLFFVVVVVVEMRSHYVTQAGLKLPGLLLLFFFF